MTELIGEIGNKYGKLEVIVYSGDDKHGYAYWNCLCDCGKVTRVCGISLRSGHTKSCGCIVNKNNRKNERKCSKCKKWLPSTTEFFGKDTRTKIGLQSFCKQCNHEYQAKWRLKNETKCLDCGKLIDNRTKTNRCKPCSVSGKNNGMFGKPQSELVLERLKGQIGENNPNWKGGITPEKMRLRNARETTDWRKTIFKQDNFICQKCLKKGWTLHAHHILSVAEHPNLQYDLNNGITFCEKHHREFHSIYGLKFINEKQVIEYINKAI